ncbi:zinc transporter 4, chloroplastic [Artemisia annua]|uniref:Zinc transporter 4, chloroplastic n=1 Tax=Artemisia annua TaxID=35608 RepID=A0A2U1KPS6_ARTAN|nr:zinc transporter 4, chloroplastic [Artemisia annua]
MAVILIPVSVNKKKSFYKLNLLWHKLDAMFQSAMCMGYYRLLGVPTTISGTIICCLAKGYYRLLGVPTTISGTIICCLAKTLAWTRLCHGTFNNILYMTGVDIGIVISNSYNPNSPRSLVVEGIMGSLSSGILIYMALVDLLADDSLRKMMTCNRRINNFINAEVESLKSHIAQSELQMNTYVIGTLKFMALELELITCEYLYNEYKNQAQIYRKVTSVTTPCQSITTAGLILWKSLTSSSIEGNLRRNIPEEVVDAPLQSSVLQSVLLFWTLMPRLGYDYILPSIFSLMRTKKFVKWYIGAESLFFTLLTIILSWLKCKFETEYKAVDNVQTSLGDARMDQQNTPQVIPLTQTQLDDAMKLARFNMTHVKSIGDHATNLLVIVLF